MKDVFLKFMENIFFLIIEFLQKFVVYLPRGKVLFPLEKGDTPLFSFPKRKKFHKRSWQARCLTGW
jgi:hypothetical protein